MLEVCFIQRKCVQVGGGMKQYFDFYIEQLISVSGPSTIPSQRGAKLADNDAGLFFCKLLDFGSVAQQAWLSCLL